MLLGMVGPGKAGLPLICKPVSGCMRYLTMYGKYGVIATPPWLHFALSVCTCNLENALICFGLRNCQAIFPGTSSESVVARWLCLSMVASVYCRIKSLPSTGKSKVVDIGIIVYSTLYGYLREECGIHVCGVASSSYDHTNAQID